MSDLGHLRQTETLPTLAACPFFPRKRTNSGQSRYVRLVPKAAQRIAANKRRYSIISSARKRIDGGNLKAERLGRFEVDHQLIIVGASHRQIVRLFTLVCVSDGVA
jgi:hypothetical protein